MLCRDGGTACFRYRRKHKSGVLWPDRIDSPARSVHLTLFQPHLRSLGYDCGGSAGFKHVTGAWAGTCHSVYKHMSVFTRVVAFVGMLFFFAPKQKNIRSE